MSASTCLYSPYAGFIVLFRVILCATKSFHVVFVPLAPGPGDATDARQVHNCVGNDDYYRSLHEVIDTSGEVRSQLSVVTVRSLRCGVTRHTV